MTAGGDPIRTVHFGLGPIGLATLRSVAARQVTQISGAVDVRPELHGLDVGVLAGIEPLGVAVVGALSDVGPPGSADVVLNCAGSRLASVEPQIVQAMEWGAAVITTCEELAYPWLHHPTEAARIDAAARAAGRAVLATGINPGFAMDALALHLSAVAERVERVHVRRVVDAGARRGPLQLKVGAGISAPEFEVRRQAGTIGHVGLVESAAMLAAGLGWTLDSITETLEPVIARSVQHTDVVKVAEGSVAGIRQVAIGASGGRERVRLELEMYVGAADPCDETVLFGTPELHTSTIGIHGDICTAAITANAAVAVARLPTGLLTMLDLLPLRAAPGRVAGPPGDMPRQD